MDNLIPDKIIHTPLKSEPQIRNSANHFAPNDKPISTYRETIVFERDDDSINNETMVIQPVPEPISVGGIAP